MTGILTRVNPPSKPCRLECANPGLDLKGVHLWRKWFLAGAGLLAASLVAALFVIPSLSNADAREKIAKAEAGQRNTQLPIGQVVLFSSGVGYFQREGTVEGDARVDLSFPVSDINDLIKSMVLRDLDGGHISAVSYDSSARPIARSSRSPST